MEEERNPMVVTKAVRVRFLNADNRYEELNIQAGGAGPVPLAFGEVSDYMEISAGFQDVLVTGVRSRNIYLQKAVPFWGGLSYTLAIIPSVNGMDVLPIMDINFNLFQKTTGCVRMANLSFGSTPYDLLLYGGRMVFDDVVFKEVTPCRAFLPGNKDFYMKSTLGYEPLVSLAMEIEAGHMYTIYVMGSPRQDEGFRILVLEN